MDDELDELTKAQAEVLELLTQVDMTTELFYEVVERTQNFREGFYSNRRVTDLARTAARQMQRAIPLATTPDEVCTITRNFIQDMKNVLATLMTEIDRIDE